MEKSTKVEWDVEEGETSTDLAVDQNAVLYVDDEPKALKYFERYFKGKFKIYTAEGVEDAYRILNANHDKIAVLITDHRMPGQKGAQMLEHVRRQYPDIVRMITTAFPEPGVAIDAINRSAAYRFITKPWDIHALTDSISAGRKEYVVQKRRRMLMRERCVLLSKVGRIDRTACLSTLAVWAGLNVRNSLVPVKKFLDAIPGQLEGENLQSEDLENTDFWNASLGKVGEQLTHTNDLLTDLYAVSKQLGYNFDAQVNLGELVDAATETLKDELDAAGLTVTNEFPEDLPAVQGDRLKFARLFELLLKRRIQHTPDGGSIRMSARVVPGDDPANPMIQLSVVHEPAKVPGSVIMNPSAVYAQFEKEARDAEAGLYMLISYLIIYFHGGVIESDPKPGETDHMKILLPVHQG